MAGEDSSVIHDSKLITCIVPVGLGSDLVDALFHEWQVTTANVIRGRGASQRSGTFADEMDILTVLIEPERADEIFEYLYGKAEIGSEPHRFMYQGPLTGATLFSLPEAVAEEED